MTCVLLYLLLGLRTSPIRKANRTISKDGENIKISAGLSINFFFNRNVFGLNENIVAMEERLANMKKLGGQVEHSKVYITKIEEYTPKEDEKFYCIEVDTPSHLFLAGETFVPTHNTTMLEALTKNIPWTTIGLVLQRILRSLTLNKVT